MWSKNVYPSSKSISLFALAQSGTSSGIGEDYFVDETKSNYFSWEAWVPPPVLGPSPAASVFWAGGTGGIGGPGAFCRGIETVGVVSYVGLAGMRE